MTRSHLLMAGIVIAGLFHAGPALSADDPVPIILTDRVLPDLAASPSTQPVAIAAIKDEPAAAPKGPFASAPTANDAKLAGVTGMADLNVLDQIINVKNTSTVTGNIINGDPTTGTISIDGASFGGFNGLALVNANTGNNVSINAAMNVNVAIQP